ncbi:MAG: SlyX family protein [Gammaproteobacteria bacterium]
MTDESRLETLEFKVAHLEDAVQRLSDLAYEQARLIDAMLERHRQLLRQVETLEGKNEERVPVEIPPHY